MAAVAAASEPVAEEAALRLLSEGGNAVDAVLAGFFAAAGAAEGTLLSPMGAVIAGVGLGARWFDGRCRQPGQGLKRPRGLREGDAFIAASEAALPGSIPMVVLLHAHAGLRPMSALVKPGMSLAKKHGSQRRAQLLKDIVHHGAPMLTHDEIARHLLAAAGPAAGGTLSEADLQAMPASNEPVQFVRAGGLEGASAEWASSEDVSTLHAAQGRAAQVVVAADPRGMVVALGYMPDGDGILVPELEVRLPRDGSPVRRGVPRVSPGTTIAAPLPIGVLQRRADGWFAAIGLAGSQSIKLSRLDGSAPTLQGQLEQLLGGGGSLALAAAVQRQKTQLVRTAAIR